MWPGFSIIKAPAHDILQRAQSLNVPSFPSRLTALCFLCITQIFLIQRLRTENLLVRQKMEMLEQESSDLADRLIQVRRQLAGTQSSIAPFISPHIYMTPLTVWLKSRVTYSKSEICRKTPQYYCLRHQQNNTIQQIISQYHPNVSK